MKHFRNWICAACLLWEAVAIGQTSNFGREFLFASPPNQIDGKNQQQLGYVRVFIIGDSGTVGTIEVPKINLLQTFFLDGSGNTTVTLPFAAELQDSENQHAVQRAIHVQSTDSIGVFLFSHRMWSSDLTMCFPVTALDTEYVVASYWNDPLSGIYPPTIPATQFAVVASEDNTTLTILPTADMRAGKKKGIPFSVSLGRGDAYLVQGIYDSTSQDFTGTHIAATHPIALMGGHACTSIPAPPKKYSMDILLEQLPGVSQLDTFAVCVPFGGRINGDVFRIIAAFDSTHVWIGNQSRRMLNKSDFLEIDTVSAFTVHTSKPALEMQYMKTTDTVMTTWDPALSLVVPPSRWLRAYRYVLPIDTAYHVQYVTVIIPDSARQSLRVDGAAVAGPFYPVPGTSFVYIYIPQAQGYHNLSANSPFGAVIYGGGNADSYATVAGGAYANPSGLHVDAFTHGFDTLRVGTCRDTFILITNTGTGDIHVSTLRIVGGGSTGFTIITPLPITLKPGTSANVVVRFCPPKRGVFVQQLEVESDAREHPVLTLTGRGIQRFVTTVSTDTIHGKVGDTVAAPLHLLAPLDSAEAQTVSVSMRYDPAVLFPLFVSSGVTSPGFTFAVSRNDSGCTVTGIGSATLRGTGLLATVMMQVLLGDSMATTLTLFDPTVRDSDVTMRVESGMFILDTLCGGANSLITIGVPLLLSSVSPNPLNTDALISYDLPALGPVHLALVNMLGRVVVTLASGELPAGHYATLLHAGSLPAGAYCLVLQAGRFREIRRVVIVR